MANLRDIKRRISSVRSTQKITKAMKMVAASKLRRAQAAITQARPYAFRMRSLVHALTQRSDFTDHALLRKGITNTIAVVVITSDKGLCGGFNANIVNRALATMDKEFKGKDVELIVAGRKGLEALKRRQVTIRHNYTSMADQPVTLSKSIVQDVSREFAQGKFAEVYCVYNEFKSAVQQSTTLERLLPLEAEAPGDGDRPLDYLYEPSAEAIFEALLMKDFEIQVHRILLESSASELGARMTAMDAATRNAGEVIGKLTLQYNRARQNAITTELIEVISGAEAL